jgi:dihydroneopterin aldolase
MCISDTGIIELDGMEFHAFHGCLERERREGNTFMVDFRGELDLRKSSESDDLEDTVNYGEIYDIIKAEMETASNLLEHVAGRILRSVSSKFPEFISFTVRVSKKNPPVDGPVQWSRVTLTYNRNR